MESIFDLYIHEDAQVCGALGAALFAADLG